MRRNRLFQILKILISAGLLVFLFSLVDLADLAEQARGINLFWLALHVALSFFAIFISAWKWKLLCDAGEIRTTRIELLGLYLIGIFYNHFLPTSVGGDVVRGYELSRRDCTLPGVYASIFVERYTGLAVLLLLVLVALPFDVRFYGDLRVLAPAGVLVAGFVLGSWMVFSPSLLRQIELRFQGRLMQQVIGKVRNFQVAIRRYQGHKGTIAVVFFISLLFYANAILTTYTGLLALGAEASLPSLFIAVPVMLMLFLIPISLGGLGLQEWAHVFVMSILGAPPIIGVSLGLLFRLRSILFGLVGGLVMLMRSGGVLRIPVEPERGKP